MQRSNGARIFPLIIILIVVVLLIAAIVAAGRAIFSGGDSGSSSEVIDRSRENLLKVNAEQSVSMTVRGPITADETFTSYRVQISTTERDFAVYRGYLEDRVRGKTLDNNIPAYEQFVYALDKANMMKGNEPRDDAENDLRGICASGYVYEFATLTNNESTKTLWTSTCSGSTGTLDASKEQLADLFLAQIPGSEDSLPFAVPTAFRY